MKIEQIETYMGSMEHFLKNVASDRELSRDRLNEIAENLEFKLQKMLLD